MPKYIFVTGGVVSSSQGLACLQSDAFSKRAAYRHVHQADRI